jgi:hypothetical protein
MGSQFVTGQIQLISITSLRPTTKPLRTGQKLSIYSVGPSQQTRTFRLLRSPASAKWRLRSIRKLDNPLLELGGTSMPLFRAFIATVRKLFARATLADGLEGC